MTGSVKEEILTRQAELGWAIENGCLTFSGLLLDPKELLSKPASYNYLDVTGTKQNLELAAGCLVYTICQVPVIAQLAIEPGIEVHLTDGTILKIDGKQLDAVDSHHIFQRDGIMHHLVVRLSKASFQTDEQA